MTPAVRGLAWAPHCLLAAALMLLVACDSGGSAAGRKECPPRQAPAQREDGAEAVLTLIEAQAPFVQAEVPGLELRHVYFPVAEDGAPASFLYAPTPSKGTPTTLVSRDANGAWRLARDERVVLPDNMPVLDLTDLRLSPEAVVAEAESRVPGLDVAGAGLAREGCELTWYVGGFVLGPDGRPLEVVEGIVPDATGVFELQERSDAPGRR